MKMPRIASMAAIIAMAVVGTAQAQDAAGGGGRHGAMRQACQADIAKLCADVQPGGGRLMQCFKAHRDALSDGCRSALMAMRAEHRAGAGEAPAPH